MVPSLVQQLVQTSPAHDPSLADARTRFCKLRRTFWIAALVVGTLLVLPLPFAGGVVKALGATAVLVLGVLLNRQSNLWSDAMSDVHAALSQRLLQMCRSHTHQEVKLWLEAEKIQPWAVHVIRQYLKNYAMARV